MNKECTKCLTPEQKAIGGDFRWLKHIPVRWKYPPLNKNGISVPEIEEMAICPVEKAQHGTMAIVLPNGECALWADDNCHYVARYLSPEQLCLYMDEPERVAGRKEMP